MKSVKERRGASRTWLYVMLTPIALASLAFLILLGYAGLRELKGKYSYERVEKTFTFELTAQQSQTMLWLPPDTEPQLLEYSLENAGTTDIGTPRLLVDSAPRLWTLDEIVAECGGVNAPPEEMSWCLFELLQARLERADDEYLGKGFPFDEVLPALNDYGLSQCGPTSRYLCQLARHAGLPARQVSIGVHHVVAEIFWADQWHMFDTDRNFLAVDDDYRQVLSLQEIRENPLAIFRTPGIRWSGGNPNLQLLEGQAVMADIEPTPFTSMEIGKIPLPPGGRIEIPLAEDAPTRGLLVTWLATRKGAEPWDLTLPYPVLSLRLQADRDVVIVDQTNKQEAKLTAGRAIDWSYQNPIEPWFAVRRDHRLVFSEPEKPLSLTLTAQMRRASLSVPRLHDGPNRLSVESVGDAWRVTVKMRVSLLAAKPE
jgi:hypothetical protein